jgi:hypothetical protein
MVFCSFAQQQEKHIFQRQDIMGAAANWDNGDNTKTQHSNPAGLLIFRDGKRGHFRHFSQRENEVTFGAQKGNFLYVFYIRFGFFMLENEGHLMKEPFFLKKVYLVLFIGNSL